MRDFEVCPDALRNPRARDISIRVTHGIFRYPVTKELHKLCQHGFTEVALYKYIQD